MKRTTAMACAVVALVLGSVAGWKAHAWLDLDGCLDGGGTWDNSKQTCRYK